MDNPGNMAMIIVTKADQNVIHITTPPEKFQPGFVLRLYFLMLYYDYGIEMVFFKINLKICNGQESGDRDQGSGDRRQETGDRSQETGIRDQETGIRDQETGIRDQETGIRGQGTRVRNQWSGSRNIIIRDGEMVVGY